MLLCLSSRWAWMPALLLGFFPGPVRAGDPVERGRYLVEEVGKCGDCHTPLTTEGAPDAARRLKGAVLGFQPIQPVKNWHKTAPDLTPAGRLWQKWGESALLKFLETGVAPSGNRPGPPMPAYMLKHEDAEAVVAYLKSLR